ncbi:YgaP family membrane protein [Variovorax paradoxus]|uniref:YgaP family membrane protein n=1 Tax=Variovorax paradoxus TaxID=34073 RepID=UPI002780757E|nr:DUF2892 domain-containing protein [Variovorax paradoxus]MDP9932003.1 hypothetical protein [Variovorax paradoxus]
MAESFGPRAALHARVNIFWSCNVFHLKRNIPAWERVIRLCLGVLAALGAFYFLPPGGLQVLGFAVAAMMGGTAVVGFCPACAMLGRRAVGSLK